MTLSLIYTSDIVMNNTETILHSSAPRSIADGDEITLSTGAIDLSHLTRDELLNTSMLSLRAIQGDETILDVKTVCHVTGGPSLQKLLINSNALYSSLYPKFKGTGEKGVETLIDYSSSSSSF